MSIELGESDLKCLRVASETGEAIFSVMLEIVISFLETLNNINDYVLYDDNYKIYCITLISFAIQFTNID